MLVIATNGWKIFYWKDLNWCKAQWTTKKRQIKIDYWTFNRNAWFENLPFPFRHAFTCAKKKYYNKNYYNNSDGKTSEDNRRTMSMRMKEKYLRVEWMANNKWKKNRFFLKRRVKKMKAKTNMPRERKHNNTKSMASDLILPDKWTKWHFAWYGVIVIVSHWNRTEWKGSQTQNRKRDQSNTVGIKAIANEFIKFGKVQWILVSPRNDEKENNSREWTNDFKVYCCVRE